MGHALSNGSLFYIHRRALKAMRGEVLPLKSIREGGG